MTLETLKRSGKRERVGTESGNDPGKLRRGKLVIGKVSEFEPDTTFGVSV